MKYLNISIIVSLLFLSFGAFASLALAQGPYGSTGGPQGRTTDVSPAHTSVYIVRRGDTLFRIARRFDTSLGTLLAANPHLGNPNRIFPGQRVIIPAARPVPSIYVVKRGDTLFRIARRFGTSVGSLLAANPQIRNPNRIFAGERLRIPTGFASVSPGRGDAYGGTQQPATPPMTDQDMAQRQAEVVMQNVSFQPQRVTVEAGTTVTWINRDSFAHTVTAGTRDNPTGMFDSGNINGGETFSFMFPEPGTYSYFCSIHPGMNGVVVVEEAAQGMTQQQTPQQQAPAPGDDFTGGGYGGY